MIHWFLFTLNATSAFNLSFLWAVFHKGSINGIEANAHIVNGIITIVDLWISGVPIQLLHFIYPVIFAAAYPIFSGIYTSISGIVIYKQVLNFRDQFDIAVSWTVLLTFVFTPLVHVLVFYLQYFVKFWILYYIFGRKQEPLLNDEDFEAEDSEAIEQKDA